jgi:hypothetical protein
MRTTDRNASGLVALTVRKTAPAPARTPTIVSLTSAGSAVVLAIACVCTSPARAQSVHAQTVHAQKDEPKKELDPRVTELLSRVDAEFPGWLRDDDLAPAAVAAWDHKTEAGKLCRVSVFKNTMGNDAKTFVESMTLAFPGAHIVGTPLEIVTPVATGFKVSFEIPGEGFAYVWHETLGLKGPTACSPGMFAMFKGDTEEDLTKVVAAGEPIIRPAFQAYERYAYSLRLEEKSGAATLTTGQSSMMKLTMPKGFKDTPDHKEVLAWQDESGGTLTLDVRSTLEGSTSDVIAQTTAKLAAKPTVGKDPSDISFTEGDGKDRRWVRLKLVEEGGYILLLKASTPVEKRATFEKTIAPVLDQAKILPKEDPAKKPAPTGKNAPTGKK